MEIIRTLRLDKINKKGYCPIRITCYFEGKRVFLAPGVSVEPKFWDEEKGKVKGKEPQHVSKNQILNNWEDSAEKVYYQSTVAGERLGEEEFKNRVIELEEKRGNHSASAIQEPAPEPETNHSFFKLFDQYLSAKAREISPVTMKVMAKRTIWDLAATRDRLLDFQQTKGFPLSLEGMDKRFYAAYRDYLLHEVKNQDGSTGQKVNTFGKHIKRLKSFLAWCEEADIAVNRKYTQFEAPEKYVGVEALYPHEIRALYEYDFFTDTVRQYLAEKSLRQVKEGQQKRVLNFHHIEERLKILDECRDCFMLAVSTGLSISDAFALREDKHIRNGLIIIPRTKTTNECYIPLVQDDLFRPNEIIARHRGKQATVLPVNWDINNHLKDIQQLTGVGLGQNGTVRVLLTFKVARKSFVTNKIYQGVPARLVMQSTGHRTESAFNRYLGVDVEELKKQFQLMSDRQKVA